MKKLIALLCSLGLMASTTAFASDLSSWAVSDYELINRSGILTKDMFTNNLKQPITREEVAAMMVNFYTQLTGIEIEVSHMPFSDTTNGYVSKAYAAGIVSGKGWGLFDPAGAVTRQEFAKMLFNTLNAASVDPVVTEAEIWRKISGYEDTALIADWAKDAFFVALHNDIITGVTSTQLAPTGYTTREQAFCIMGRSLKKFAGNPKIYNVPQFLGASTTDDGQLVLSWSEGTAYRYYVIIRDQLGQVVRTFQTRTNYSILYDELPTGTYTVTIGIDAEMGIQTFSTPAEFTFISQVTAPAPSTPVIPAPVETAPAETSPAETIPTQGFMPTTNYNATDKEARVFPNGLPFSTPEEAQANMTKVTVPVWKLSSNGTKTSGNFTIEVNSALAADVVSIFTEIYNSPEQFPINSLGGYYWRNTASGRLSQHSYGTCIDINPNENYYVQPDGTPIVGSFWKPYENPHSIPEDGIVVKTFAKYGWEWGGNCWGDSYAKDYMHLTYLGK